MELLCRCGLKWVDTFALQREDEGPTGRGDGVDEVLVEEEKCARRLVVVIVVSEKVGRDRVNQLQGARENVICHVPDLAVSACFEEAVEGATEGCESGPWGRGSD